MNRKTLDRLLSAAGFVVAIVMLVASGLLFWAHNFVNDEVSKQLSAQNVFFPEAGSDAFSDPRIGPYLEQYAGQQMTNGAQARAYADHYIAVHLEDMAGGQTYSELSEASRADPDNAELAGLVQTAFRGETLRGLLLNAYAFWKMGEIALWAAISTLIGALLLLVLSGLGFMHASRVGKEQEAAAAPAPETPAIA